MSLSMTEIMKFHLKIDTNRYYAVILIQCEIQTGALNLCLHSDCILTFIFALYYCHIIESLSSFHLLCLIRAHFSHDRMPFCHIIRLFSHVEQNCTRYILILWNRVIVTWYVPESRKSCLIIFQSRKHLEFLTPW